MSDVGRLRVFYFPISGSVAEVRADSSVSPRSIRQPAHMLLGWWSDGHGVQVFVHRWSLHFSLGPDRATRAANREERDRWAAARAAEAASLADSG